MLKYFVKLVVLMFAVALGRLGYEKMIELPSFDLKSIELNGDCDMSKDSVLNLSGLKLGESIYKQNLKFALSKLSRHPVITKCEIERGLVSQIDISIDVAEPALLIKGKGLYSLSREGVVLPFESNMPVLPLVSGRKFTRVRLYDRLRDPDVVYALRLYESILAQSSELCSRLSEINFSYKSQIRVFFSPGGTVAVLDKRDFDEAVKRLVALHNNGILEGRKIFDMRFGTVAVESSIKKGIL